MIDSYGIVYPYSFQTAKIIFLFPFHFEPRGFRKKLPDSNFLPKIII